MKGTTRLIGVVNTWNSVPEYMYVLYVDLCVSHFHSISDPRVYHASIQIPH